MPIIWDFCSLFWFVNQILHFNKIEIKVWETLAQIIGTYLTDIQPFFLPSRTLFTHLPRCSRINFISPPPIREISFVSLANGLWVANGSSSSQWDIREIDWGPQGKDFFLFIISHIGQNSCFSTTRYYGVFLWCQELWQSSCNYYGMDVKDKPNWLKMADRHYRKSKPPHLRTPCFLSKHIFLDV